jgi:conjugative relaxase-like TrwC/TraI family protein
MLTISKPLSAGQVRRYHDEEFTNARENYYTARDEIGGEWHGQLAAQWGLSGEVSEEQFQRLAGGQHPTTGEQVVRHQTSRSYTNARGDRLTTLDHRAGWDATFSAPKSVSLTALVGQDDRVRQAHHESVTVALDHLEGYVQARIGRNHPAQTTGRWVAARFDHDSARPVDGYAAPQLHTHVVVFNVTETEQGETRALQPRELYKTQQYATAVYRSELATRLKALGYEIDRGSSGQPEIRGYSTDYLEASSPRRRQIEEHLAQEGQRGAGAAQVAAHHTRESKLACSHDDMQRRHSELANAFGQQPAKVVEAAQGRARHSGLAPRMPAITAAGAVTFANDRNFEREAVVDERALVRDALRRSMGEAPVDAIKTEFQARVVAGELIAVDHRPGVAGRAFTTLEMLNLERDLIETMRAGQNRHAPLAASVTVEDLERALPRLSERQRVAVEHILSGRDQIMSLEGVAGSGKTTTLAVVRDAVEREGYAVEGLAPTSRAAQRLSEAGISSGTLQRHLVRIDPRTDRQPRLYVLDESSLASTRQMHRFIQRLDPDDRVLLVGDVRQHQAVEAGRPYQQLQEGGLDTVRLNDIVRQTDPALKAVVEHLSKGHVREAIRQLDTQGRVHEIRDREERLRAIAQAYVTHPDGTIVVSPDNHSRIELNEVIHHARQAGGQVGEDECRVRVLVSRQDVTGADRQWAEQYERGDVVRYTTGSQVLGIAAGEYARVHDVNAKQNRVTVARDSGEQVTYDPRRLHGVTIYREAERVFATGDRVQSTAPDRERRVANRELGTVAAMDATRHLHVRLDSGRTIAFPLDGHAHLDLGYAVTSHSSQGLTADRVLVHIDTDRAGETLVNSRLAYVALSRGRSDAQIYTNDRIQLVEALGREVSHRSALEPSRTLESAAHARESSGSSTQTVAQVIGR